MAICVQVPPQSRVNAASERNTSIKVNINWSIHNYVKSRNNMVRDFYAEYYFGVGCLTPLTTISTSGSYQLYEQRGLAH